MDLCEHLLTADQRVTTSWGSGPFVLSQWRNARVWCLWVFKSKVLMLWWITSIIQHVRNTRIRNSRSSLAAYGVQGQTLYQKQKERTLHKCSRLLAQGPWSSSDVCICAAESSTPLFYNKEEVFLCLNGSPLETHPWIDLQLLETKWFSHLSLPGRQDPSQTCCPQPTPILHRESAREQEYCFIFIVVFFFYDYFLFMMSHTGFSLTVIM